MPPVNVQGPAAMISAVNMILLSLVETIIISGELPVNLKFGFAQMYVAEKILDSGEKSRKVSQLTMLNRHSPEKRMQADKTVRRTRSQIAAVIFC